MTAAAISRSAPHAPASPGEGGTILALQYLRAVAALVIVVYHICRFRDFAVVMQGTWLKSMTDSGAAAAVDLFFALSGFLMVYTQSTRPRDARDFFRRRVFRIVPAYWALTIAWFVMMAVTSSPEHPNPYSPLHLISSLMFCSQLFGFEFPLILPGWSLEYEMVFYAVMALAIWSGGARFALITCAAVVALVGAQALRPVCLEFAFGVVAGIAFPRRLPRRFALPALAVGLAVFVYGSSLLHGEFDNDWYRLAFWGVPMFIVLLNGLNFRPARIPVLLFLAECSYSLYISHHVAIYVYAKLASLGLLHTGWGWLGVACCFTFCIAVGVAVHYLVERSADDVLAGRASWGWKRPARRQAGPPLPA